MIELRNPRYLEDGRIDCEVNHPQLGWVPYTASEDDTAPYGPAIFAAAKAVEPVAFEPPSAAERQAAARRAAILDRGALCTALYRAGALSADEAVAAARGDWPRGGAIEDRIAWAAATLIERDSALLKRLIVLPDDVLDAVFGIA